MSSLITTNGRHSIKVIVQGENSTVVVPVSKSIGVEDNEGIELIKSLPIQYMFSSTDQMQNEAFALPFLK